MLKIPKIKLYIARALRYTGIVLAVILCVTYISLRSSWLFFGLLIAFIAVTAAGEQWIRKLYSCPKCRERLLPYRGRGGLEKSCPEFCPHCGERIEIEFTD